MWPREWLQRLAHGRQTALAAHEQRRIVLADVAPRDQRKLRRGRRSADLTKLTRVDLFDHVGVRRADVHQQVVQLLGTRHSDLGVALQVVDHEVEPLMHLVVDDQPRRVERIREDLVERQVPGAGLGLVGHEDDDWLGRPLFELHLAHARAEAADVAREGIDQQVLASAVLLQALRNLGDLFERVPGQTMNPRTVDPFAMGHDQVDVVADAGDMKVHQRVGLAEQLVRSPEQLRMDLAVPHETADIRLDAAECDPHRSPSFGRSPRWDRCSSRITLTRARVVRPGAAGRRS